MATTMPHVLPVEQIPVLELARFRRQLIDRTAGGGRLAALFGQPIKDHIRLYAVLANDESSDLAILSADVAENYEALTPECPQAHWFEREIAEQWGVIPRGHPWLKPIRFHPSYRPGRDAWGRTPGEPIEPGVTDFYRMEGEEVHEVAVGPIHAGVIEPGHFRFQCHGENVYHLEISLGYQHRGVEPALCGGPTKRTIHYMETLAGDTTIGHATAYCQVVEALAGCRPPLRAEAIRGLALELERLANHTGDLGALANDVGFLPAAAYCGRLRGDFLNATAQLCGSRFGRGLVRPGGAAFDLEPATIDTMQPRLEKALSDVAGAVRVLWDSLSVQARFEDTGKITAEKCNELGLTGPCARACGLVRDVRQDFPAGIHRFSFIPVSTWHSGDVFARAYVRWLEIQRSGQFVLQQLGALPPAPVKTAVASLRPTRLAVALVEGWRGEICHVAITDHEGRFARYKVIDPSFHNWIGLALALRQQQISDFPLCNKSFNLSYCGHDL
jgi:Ni,Fe-hydrogenase III large subunit